MRIKKIRNAENIVDTPNRSKRKVKQRVDPQLNFADIFADIIPKNIRYKGNNQFENIDQSRDIYDHSVNPCKKPYNIYWI
ncbi:hypothetical protein GF336_07695 [Candidatus Woesearchaeota archaeon]|nr:hypothetical protein [Candidatus Woesearchaeota archaeon]